MSTRLNSQETNKLWGQKLITLGTLGTAGQGPTADQQCEGAGQNKTTQNTQTTT